MIGRGVGRPWEREESGVAPGLPAWRWVGWWCSSETGTIGRVTCFEGTQSPCGRCLVDVQVVQASWRVILRPGALGWIWAQDRDLEPACLSVVIAVMECDELSPRAHVDSGERRSRPQAEDPGFGNVVEMCKNESAYRVISANIY